MARMRLTVNESIANTIAATQAIARWDGLFQIPLNGISARATANSAAIKNARISSFFGGAAGGVSCSQSTILFSSLTLPRNAPVHRARETLGDSTTDADKGAGAPA